MNTNKRDMELCGNVFVSKDMTAFAVKCLLCGDEISELEEFVEHVRSHKPIIDEPLMDENNGVFIFASDVKDDDRMLEFANEESPVIDEVHKDADVDAGAVSKLTIEMPTQSEEEAEIEENGNSAEEFSEFSLDESSDFETEVKRRKTPQAKKPMQRTNKVNSQLRKTKSSQISRASKFQPTLYRRNQCTMVFIELYKKQQCLWDTKHPDYDRPAAQDKAYENMIKEIEKRFHVFLDRSTLQSFISKIRKQYYAVSLAIEEKKSKQLSLCTVEHYKKCKFLGQIEETQAEPPDESHNDFSGIINKHKYLIFADSQRLTDAFISAYQRFPALYDPSHPDFARNFKRRECYIAMADILKAEQNVDFSADKIYRLIVSLRRWHSYAGDRLKMSEKLTAQEREYLQKCDFIPQKQRRQKFSCELCENVSTTELTFKVHMFEAHQVGEMPFKCSECHQGFKQNCKLQIHMQRYHQAKAYECEYCHKKFSVSADHRLHVRTHTEEKPYVCELCGKAFRIRTQLGYHVNAIHTKIRAFKCTMCPKDFLKQSLLNDHIKSHLNIRDKICQICGKGFTNCHSLIRHRQIHSEVKKFACKMCDARFHQFVGLNSHMKRTHNIVRSNKATSSSVE